MDNNEVSKILLDRRYMISTVIFITVFSVLFMIIYSPFSDTSWLGFAPRMRLVLSVSYYLVAVSVLIVSKLLMSALSHKIRFNTFRYVLWLIGEYLLLSLFYNFFSIIYQRLFIGQEQGIIWLRSFLCVAAIMTVPYVIATLYAAYRSKAEELAMERYERSVLAENAADVQRNAMVNLRDYNGTVRLSLDAESLYYVESQDNYVKIYYESEGKIHNYMLRCSTKNIESAFAGTQLVRCHRSFIVNISKIKVVRNEKGTMYIELKHQGMRHIPVSKNYAQVFSAALLAAEMSVKVKQAV